jgi:hypothetical protein
VSPFRPSFLPQPAVYSQPFDFVGPLFSYSYELLFPQPLCFDNDLNCPGGGPSSAPFQGDASMARCTKGQKCGFVSPLFATLTHSLSRKSFPCHSYENTRDGAGIVISQSPILSVRSVPVPAPTRSGWQIPCSQKLAASLSSLCALFCTGFLCFQELAASFAKTPGWGVPATFLATRRFSPLAYAERPLRRATFPLLSATTGNARAVMPVGRRRKALRGER